MIAEYVILKKDAWGDFALPLGEGRSLSTYICSSGLLEFFKVPDDADTLYFSVSENKKKGYTPIEYVAETVSVKNTSTGREELLLTATAGYFARVFNLSLPIEGAKIFYVACWAEKSKR